MPARIKIGMMNDKPDYFPKNVIKNLRHLKALLLGKDLPESVITKVMDSAKKFPEGSLNYFWKGIDSHINKAIEKVKKEQKTEEVVVKEEVKEEKPIVAKKEKKVAKKRTSILDNVEPIVIAKEEQQVILPQKNEPIKAGDGTLIPKDEMGRVDLDSLILARKALVENQVRNLSKKED